jgi:hypothetical protein
MNVVRVDNRTQELSLLERHEKRRSVSLARMTRWRGGTNCKLRTERIELSLSVIRIWFGGLAPLSTQNYPDDPCEPAFQSLKWLTQKTDWPVRPIFGEQTVFNKVTLCQREMARRSGEYASVLTKCESSLSLDLSKSNSLWNLTKTI